MTDARTEILERTRAALGAPDPRQPQGVVVPRDYRQAGALHPPHEEMIEQLVDRLVDYRAEVVRCASGEITVRVREALQDKGVRSIVIPPDLDRAWVGEDVEVIVDDGRLTAYDLDVIGAVVTTSRVAVAETGTIVLDGQEGNGRRVLSLVPDVHVCVVREDQVVPTVPDAVAQLTPTRPLTWISGPSATSDIELSRVEGVHGPRTLIVLLVAD